MFILWFKGRILENPVVWVCVNDYYIMCTMLLFSKSEDNTQVYLPDFLGRRTAWMLGRTPPAAMVTPPSNLLSSSSFFTARVM